ncbi:MAG: GntR family transcriptional regulator [Rhodobacteraceae bacterium]|nr:GntR family transcriptional regulator [Paracoccaceae bacterium]
MTETPEPADQQAAGKALRDFIDTGQFAPGDRLPPERALMVQLGLTRTALRKALDRLEHDGRIWRHVGKGTFIASAPVHDQPGRLATLSKQVTPAQMMRARLALEPALARDAALNATEAAIDTLRTARDTARDASEWDTYEASDDAFHRSVAVATGNVLLLELFDQMNQVRRAVAWNSVVRTAAHPPRDHPSFAEHDRIVAAIAARAPAEAQAAMRDHLGSVAERLFGDR